MPTTNNLRSILSLLFMAATAYSATSELEKAATVAASYIAKHDTIELSKKWDGYWKQRCETAAMDGESEDVFFGRFILEWVTSKRSRIEHLELTKEDKLQACKLCLICIHKGYAIPACISNKLTVGAVSMLLAER